MACAEYERLHQAGVDAMVAEDRVRDIPARSMAESKRLAMRDTTHAKVMTAEAILNRHIRECDVCRQDGRTPENMTVGQF